MKITMRTPIAAPRAPTVSVCPGEDEVEVAISGSLLRLIFDMKVFAGLDGYHRASSSDLICSSTASSLCLISL